jgi:hypothetical protein
MEIYMRDNGKMIKQTVMDSSLMLRMLDMTENGWMICSMERGKSSGRTGLLDTRVSSSKGKRMEQGALTGMMVATTRANL